MKKIIIALAILSIAATSLQAQTTNTGTRTTRQTGNAPTQTDNTGTRPARKADRTAATQTERQATRKANRMKAGDTANYPNRVPPVTSDTRTNIKK